MKILSALLVMGMVCVACTGSEPAARSDASTSSTAKVVKPTESPRTDTRACVDQTIRGERVGEIVVGDPVDSLKKCRVVRDTVVPDGEGTTVRKVLVALATDTIAASIVDGRVWRIEVWSSGVRTPDSLGVGTPLRRLLQMSNPRGALGEGRMFVLSPDHCGQSYEISHFGPMPRGGWTRAALAGLPDTTHVITVLVQRCYPELY